MAFGDSNVNMAYPNFCIAPIADEFCNINHASDTMQIKTSAGAVQQTFTLDTGVDEIKSIEYTGPRDLGLAYNLLGDELPFFTLESNESDTCTIRRWKLNNTGNTLDLQQTITLTTSGSNYFDTHDMAVEYYHTTFQNTTTTGTGNIVVADQEEHINPGDILLLGPSSDTDNLYAFEYVTVNSRSGTTVYIDAAEPSNEYVAGDDISFWKWIYVFSDTSQETSKGSLHQVDPQTGTVSGTHISGIYADITAAAWSLDYEAVGFVKGTNLIYTDPGVSYQVVKSQALTNVDDDDVTIWPVYDLVFESGAIYRLQQATTGADDNGSKTTYSWSPNYNYQLDSITPYTRNVRVYASPDGIILNDESVTMYAQVRDQFGVGLQSINLVFSDNPDRGEFTPLNGQAVTDANGIASITYTTNYYDPTAGGTDADDIAIDVRADGSSATIYGSQYVWDKQDLKFHKKFSGLLDDGVIQKPTLSGSWPTAGSDLYIEMYLDQIEGMENSFYITGLSKFQFPGGHWTVGGAPGDTTPVLTQLEDFSADLGLDQSADEVTSEVYLDQNKELSRDMRMSQTYISRHHSTGHTDDVDVDQFRFVEDAVPAFYSEKNPVNTNIYIRLRPFAFSLNQSTLVFRVKEVSYDGDTGFIDVTSSCVVTTFDAGGGLLGLDITYDPPNDFHHHATVYVDIEVYDTAPTPNIIWTDYWFRIIPDYKAPYIENESPDREEEDVELRPTIEFDILDAGVGVDISTLEFYVNNRWQIPTTSVISGGYHVSYTPSQDFYYGETVEIAVVCQDASDYDNTLHDAWRFYCLGSTGPWFDRGSFDPLNCSEGVYRKRSNIQFNVFAVDGTGLDQNSIIVHIGGKERAVTITPIIYRRE
jgi:hypothetical protein